MNYTTVKLGRKKGTWLRYPFYKLTVISALKISEHYTSYVDTNTEAVSYETASFLNWRQPTLPSALGGLYHRRERAYPPQADQNG